MNLLKQGFEEHAVENTAMTRKVTLDGITKSYPVYRVKLEYLFYNDQNDRIATWISQYKTAHDGQSPDATQREEYNAIIEQFIVESNPDAIKKTQTNIELVDQREPGVVLTDGRIIDGNRRFTCLRRLADKNQKYGWFETVILDRNIESSAKEIKILELSIQHGEESKVDYNPVDRLVGVYHDIVETKLLSEEEYASSTNETVNEVKTRVALAELMVEFLEFINAPRQFHIARDLQVTFPLEELLKLMKKCRTEDEKEDLKISVFNNILMQTAGDLGRFVRNFKTILGTDYQDEFLEEQKVLALKTLDTLPEVGKMSATVIREQIRSNEELHQEMERSVEKAVTKVKKNETRNRPVQLAEKATLLLEEVDVNIIQKMSDSELTRLSRQLSLLENLVHELREQLL